MLDHQVLFAFFLTLLAGIATGIGSTIAFFSKRTNTTFLCVSLGFSAGVMMYVSFVEMFPTSLEMFQKLYPARLAALYTALSFFGGILFIALIDKLNNDKTIDGILVQLPLPQQINAEAIIEHIRKDFTIPVVVKSATQGSSIGVTIVRDEAQLEEAVTEALKYDPILVVEQFLDGREFTVSVLDGKALSVIEIRPHSGEYDYKSKYTVGATEYLVPAPISAEMTAEMQRIGELVYREVQGSGVIRVDVMTDHADNMYVLEYNTVPGMTATSLVPKAAKEMGIDFPTLCEKILLTASIGKF